MGKAVAYTLQALILAIVITGFAFSFRTLTTCELANSARNRIPGTTSFGLYRFYNSTTSTCQEYPEDFDRDGKFSASIWSATLAAAFSAVAIIALLSQFIFPFCASGRCSRLKKCGINLHFTFTSILQALTFLFLTNDSVCGGVGGCVLGEGAWNLYAALGAYFVAGIVACFAPLPNEPLFRYECKRCKKDKEMKVDDGDEKKKKKRWCCSKKVSEEDKKEEHSKSDEEAPSVQTQGSVEDKRDEEQEPDEDTPVVQMRSLAEKKEEEEEKTDEEAPVVQTRSLAEEKREEEEETDDEAPVVRTQGSTEDEDWDEQKPDEEAPSDLATDAVEAEESTEQQEKLVQVQGAIEDGSAAAKAAAAAAAAALTAAAAAALTASSKWQEGDEATSKVATVSSGEREVNDSIKYQQGDPLCGGVLNICA